MPQRFRPRAKCEEFPQLFQHPLLEGGEKVVTLAERRERDLLRTKARTLCGECPLFVACLTDSVVKFEVSGFVAGTTATQRRQIRKLLGIGPVKDNLDFWAGTRSGGAVDAEQVAQIRRDNPSTPVASIAARLNCSVSTVKRHLRDARNNAGKKPARNRKEVTPQQVVAAAASVTATEWMEEAAA
ncbi:hypothetical protein GCM10028820_13980 [Tessaracoccus terricola]